ncbi:MAG: hypothetical protein II480_06915 [Bacteroidales bacterium]|jgi:hypothetical protein|nr:hypothetical protein [Bacteroidales bacterium]
MSIITLLATHDFGRFVGVNIIGWPLLFVLSVLFFGIFKIVRKDELAKEEVEIKSKKEEEKKKQQQRAEIETDDMRKIKSLMGEITQKVKQLNVFNAEIGKKISSLEQIADTAIAEAYGQIATGYKRGRYLAFYDEIRDKYSNNVDNVVALQCDHIVKKINNSIDGRHKVLQSNRDDKLKYEALYSALQNQYDKEYKIERMKAISAKVNELTDNSSEIEASLNSGFVLEKSLEEFNRLNLEIESRRDLELKYTDDTI